MKAFRISMAILSFFFVTTLVTAQEAAPKKGEGKMLAHFEKMATDLGLTADQKALAIKLAVEKAKTQGEKMQAATTDDEKKEARKAVSKEYNEKLEAAFGKELADKMRAWQKENAPAKPAAPAPAPAQ